jgi:hypothetical protein
MDSHGMSGRMANDPSVKQRHVVLFTSVGYRPGKTCLNRLVSFVIFTMMLASTARAQDSSRLVDDYIRTDFTVEDGLPDNVVNAIVANREWASLGGHGIGCSHHPPDRLSEKHQSKGSPTRHRAAQSLP